MAHTDVRVSQKLSEAHTLPAWLYTNPEVLEIEKREIFCKTWQYAGHISQVQRPGDYVTIEVADRPIVITRANDGEVRAFYNVCTHRASKLVEGEGHKSLFTCPYHAWTFRLDGTLHKASNMKGVENFHEKDFCLKPVRLEIQESFIFVNLDPNARPMSEVFGGLFEGLKKFRFENFKKSRVVETICHSNWKIGIDNYLECDHCPIIHKAFVQKLEMEDYEISIFDRYCYQGAPLKNVAADNFDLGQGGRYYWLYPNMWMSSDPGPANLSIHQSIPIDHKTTKYVYTTFLLDEVGKEAEELFAYDDILRKEDRDICEVVQKGLETGAYTQGRFSLTENCVHHFHLLLQDDLQNVLPLPQKAASL
ncbi:aromatic ring-hydroxylating oxygenase subunit alpha [Brevibacillus sp. B_LB10_24]|uniref:aromatic ring-hydroxylating oxygenase subunit alpha n=1 Tax=Brevibacillus sp. B_LB10_24 TaxID=3380645 RepID=UPI0038BCFE48